MNLNYSEEQIMLRESAKRFLADNCPIMGSSADPERSFKTDRTLWQQIAELGWTSLIISEKNGGLGGSYVDCAIISEELGRVAAPIPFLQLAIIPGLMLDQLASSTQAENLLTVLMEGESIFALAHLENQAKGQLDHIKFKASRQDGSFILNGEKVLVLGGPSADWFLVSARLEDGKAALFCVPASSTGLTQQSFRTVDDGAACDLIFQDCSVPAEYLIASGDAVLEALILAFDTGAALLCSDALGCMDALLAATVDYTKQRQQFGKPLSSFQALQHRMAEMAVKCEEARASSLLAALSIDAPSAQRIRGVSGAKVKVSEVSRHVAQEAIQLHGAIGFSEEMPIGRWFRRLYGFENSYGSTSDHLARYSGIVTTSEIIQGTLLREQRKSQHDVTGMELYLDEADIEFRDQVRTFLSASLDPELKRAERLNPTFLADPEYGLLWQKKLAAQGWAAPSWPKAHGGPGWTLTQRYIFDQECERAGEPHFRGASIKMIAPVLMRYGTDEQQAAYLPKILNGEHLWAQGYSEPGSGSDLTSLTTKAVQDGDHYIVTGSKIWSTLAHRSTHMFALVRTADTPRKSEGITFLLIDLTTPGITITPIRSIDGTHELNQTFFDEVRIPIANRIGEEGEGWEIAKYLLEFERGGSFAGGLLRALYENLYKIASTFGPDGRRAIDDPVFLSRFAEIGTDIDANDMLELMAMSQVQGGGSPGSVPSSTMKIERSRIRQSITELAASILGPDAIRWEDTRPLHLLPEQDEVDELRKVAPATYISARSQSIFGGSNEIQLEIIARTLLR